MASAQETGSSSWSILREDIGVVVWSSFLAASLATLMFFAFFDPLTLGDDQHPPAWLENRMTGYAIGFFFFWIMSAAAAALATFLLDTSHGHEPSAHGQGRH